MDLPEAQSQLDSTLFPSEPRSRPRARSKGGPPTRPPPSRLRCQKRRNLSIGGHPLTSATSERRNERERNRVKLVNLGFAQLRRHVPQVQGGSKKMSKVETLRSAVEYIRELQELLGERQVPAGERLSTSDGLSPHSSSSANSIPLSPGSCSSSLEDGSQDSSTISDPDSFLTMHGWG